MKAVRPSRLTIEIVPREDDFAEVFMETAGPNWIRERLGSIVRREDGTWFLSKNHLRMELTPQSDVVGVLQIIVRARALYIARALVEGGDG
jgi:hypothetical protein